MRRIHALFALAIVGAMNVSAESDTTVVRQEVVKQLRELVGDLQAPLDTIKLAIDKTPSVVLELETFSISAGDRTIALHLPGQPIQSSSLIACTGDTYISWRTTGGLRLKLDARLAVADDRDQYIDSRDPYGLLKGHGILEKLISANSNRATLLYSSLSESMGGASKQAEYDSLVLSMTLDMLQAEATDAGVGDFLPTASAYLAAANLNGVNQEKQTPVYIVSRKGAPDIIFFPSHLATAEPALSYGGHLYNKDNEGTVEISLEIPIDTPEEARTALFLHVTKAAEQLLTQTINNAQIVTQHPCP